MRSRAVGIFSGGLDSMLAVEVLLRQDIEVLTLTFETPFFGSERARRSARLLEVPHLTLDLTREHLEAVQNPRFGYGRQMNPCMDCHALMFRKAGEIMDREGHDFLFSGEVLGQRPFSQNRRSLAMVAQASGRPDRIVRPLSALRLEPSGPELSGLVDRTRLLDLYGRSRKRQMELADHWHIHAYPSPGGGCLLTDPIFSRKLSDLMENQPVWTYRDLHLLSLGRHLRVSDRQKVIVGRNQKENDRIQAMAEPDDILITALKHPGPVVLLPHGGHPETWERAASICLRYGDAPQGQVQPVEFHHGQQTWTIETQACPPWETDRRLI